MSFLDELETTDDSVVVRNTRGDGGVGPILFYTGLTGSAAGVVFAFIHTQFGIVFVTMGVLTAIAGWLMGRANRSLEVDAAAETIVLEGKRRSFDEVVALVKNQRIRVPGNVEDPSELPVSKHTRVWQVYLVVADSSSRRQELGNELSELRSAAVSRTGRELQDELEELSAVRFYESDDSELAAEVTAAVSRHINCEVIELPAQTDGGASPAPVDDAASTAGEG